MMPSLSRAGRLKSAMQGNAIRYQPKLNIYIQYPSSKSTKSTNLTYLYNFYPSPSPSYPTYLPIYNNRCPIGREENNKEKS